MAAQHTHKYLSKTYLKLILSGTEKALIFPIARHTGGPDVPRRPYIAHTCAGQSYPLSSPVQTRHLELIQKTKLL